MSADPGGTRRLCPAARGALIAGTLAVGIAAAATAQETQADVPQGPGSIRGHVVHPERSEVLEGLSVVLYALGSDGEGGIRRATTDADGAFVFEGISNARGTIYLVGTSSGGVPFGTRVAFKAGEIEREVEIRLSGTTADARDLRTGEARLRLGRGCSHLRVRHAHGLENPTDEVFYIPPEQRAQRRPLLRVEIPESASGFEAVTLGFVDAIERVGGEVRFWGPLYPGSHDIEFGYGLPVDGDVLPFAIGLPDGATGLHFLTPRNDLGVSGEGIATGETLQLPGGLYATAAAGAVDPGGEVAVRVEMGTAPELEGVALTDARIWLELDDAALDVNERHQFSVDSEVPLVSTSDMPLLCVPLPEGAEGLRFSDEALDMGLSRDPSGALALHGPLPPGPSTLALSYRLPVSGEPVSFERRFGADLPLLGVLLADNGILPETTRLHQRRPVRTEDRSYLHLEAFSVAAGEPIDLVLHRIERRGGLSRIAAAGFVLLGALGALQFLIGPLRAPEVTSEASDAMSHQREAVYSSIEDLEDDLATGKLSVEDHDRMHSELRARAVALLRAERQEVASRDTPRVASCGVCDSEARPNDRFCAQCGARLEAREVAG